MRVATGAVLWIVATLIGVYAVAMFELAGLGWAWGFFQRSYWDESESGFGIALGVVGLVVWLVVLGNSFVVLREGSLEDSRAAHLASATLLVVSIAVVVGMFIAVVAWPEPPSEYPLPPWNRA